MVNFWWIDFLKYLSEQEYNVAIKIISRVENINNDLAQRGIVLGRKEI